MLHVFRGKMGGWLVKFFMSLLIVAFVVWGIADVFRNFGAGTAAQIGDLKITPEQFRNAYSDRMQQFNRQLGRGITPEQARALGLDRQILAEMIGEAALDQKARKLGLNVSDKVLADKIEKSPEFAGPGGFSHDYFLMVLRSNGMNEAQYIANQRRTMLRQQIGQAIAGDITVPKVMSDAYRRYRSEERSIDFVTLGKDQAGMVPEPTPEQLKAFYDEHKVLFRAPEYRKLQMIALTPDTVAASIEMPDTELRKIYDSHKDRFVTPEKREVDQIVFPKPEDAAAASSRLTSGLSFDALAQEMKLSPKDISLGLVTKRDILDPAVANAAFSLNANQISAPVTGRFGTVILRVKKIEPSVEQPFDAVKDDLRKEAVSEQARRDIFDLHDKIEDERAAGSPVPEIANKLKLKFVTIDAVDRSGRKPDGTKLDGVPGNPDVLTAAFRAPVGTDNDTIDLRAQNGYVWFDVVSITPSHERPFEEVRAQVSERSKDQAIEKRLAARADEIRAKLDSGQTFAQAAPGISVAHRDKLVRGKAAEGFDVASVTRIFDTPEGKNGVLESPDNVGRIVYRVTGVKIPVATFDTANADTTLASGIQEDIVTEYIRKVQNDLGYSVNEAVIRSVTGADRN
jgi:peptidyl-prolyl cis-trans isomerase D